MSWSYKCAHGDLSNLIQFVENQRKKNIVPDLSIKETRRHA